MNSDDYKLQAEQHDREVAGMQAKIDQAQQSLDRERNRYNTDISAARAQIERIMPYKDDNIDHAKEIADWEGRITILEQQRDREVARIENELSQHEKALNDHQRESAKAWGAHKSTKSAEQRRRVMDLARRAQDSNQDGNSDYDVAA